MRFQRHGLPMGLIAIATDTREGIGGGERFHVAAIEAGALAQVSDVGKGALTLCGVNALACRFTEPLDQPQSQPDGWLLLVG